MNLIEELKNRNITCEGDWMNLSVAEKMVLRQMIARSSEFYWPEQLLAHDDLCDLDDLIADACTVDDMAKLRAYSRIGAVITGVARDEIDSRIRRAIESIQYGDNWNA